MELNVLLGGEVWRRRGGHWGMPWRCISLPAPSFLPVFRPSWCELLSYARPSLSCLCMGQADRGLKLPRTVNPISLSSPKLCMLGILPQRQESDSDKHLAGQCFYHCASFSVFSHRKLALA